MKEELVSLDFAPKENLYTKTLNPIWFFFPLHGVEITYFHNA